MKMCAFLLASFLTFLSVLESANSKTTSHGWSPSGDVHTMHAALNSERATFHLRSLRLDPRLSAVADAYAKDMSARGFFAHVSPEGRTLVDRLKSGNVRVFWAAENIAMDQDPHRAALRLFESPMHRANILNSRYELVGIGVARQGANEIFVEDFSN